MNTLAPSLLHRTLIALAVVTMFGILVHDTKFDKAVALALPVAASILGASSHAIDFGGNAHTHVERVSLGSAFTAIPRLQPRDDHRHVLIPKTQNRKNTPFGDSLIFQAV